MANQKKLAIVVGAGASKEYSFPIGIELKQHIVKLLDIRFEHGSRQHTGDHLIMEAFRHICRTANEHANEYLHACWRIRDSLSQAPSIDQFIHTQRGDTRIETCGKLAIVRAILKAEAASSLYIRRDGSKETLDFNRIQNTWLDALFRVVIDGCTASELDERFSAMSLIVFNYDRSIEHYLFHALRNYYNINDKRAAELIGRIQIFHPYGSVGELPWQNTSEHVAYGAEPTTEQKARASDLGGPLAANRLFKLNDLMVMDYPDGKHWALYYAQSVSLTRFLVDLEGPARFIEFVQGSQRNGPEAELRRVYKIEGFADLQARWLAFAKAESTTMTASAPEAAPRTR